MLNQPLEDSRTYFDAYSNAYLRTIRSRNKFLTKHLGLKKSLKPREIHLMAFCNEHGDTIVECTCKEWNELKGDWVFCEGCCRWLHTDCLELVEKEKASLEGCRYVCKECNMWKFWS